MDCRVGSFTSVAHPLLMSFPPAVKDTVYKISNASRSSDRSADASQLDPLSTGATADANDNYQEY